LPRPYFSLLLTLGCLHVAAAEIDFNRDVQPILAQSCHSCHGPKSQMGALRLDAKTTAMKGGQSGPSIVPGKSADSLLIHRILGAGDQARMPMGAKPLPAEKVEILKQWIDSGANWPDGVGAESAEIKKHWAFIAPKKAAVPKTKTPAWVRNPIDAFILDKLESESLTPSQPADKATLLRRASLDLIGLPPTRDELRKFLDDKSPNAYEKQIDRLLASPHYGERWARVWLDGARYADSDGFEKDKPRNVWFYRDWVINALNRDLPYDKFIIEQIAGDLLPNATQEQIVATGFLRNSMINEEGGVDPEQFRMEAMFDRMDAVGKAMLGVTIQCAQCHNHKYDPLTQEEYYRIFAFLNDSHESQVAVYTPAEQQKRAEIFRRTREIEADLQHRSADWVKRMAAWEEVTRRIEIKWTPVQPAIDDISTGGQKFVPMKDASMLAGGYAPTKSTPKATLKLGPEPITAIRLELLTDPNLPMGGPGRSIKGTGALTEFEVEAAPADAPDKVTKVKLVKATADVNPSEALLDPIFQDKSDRRRVTGPIEYAIDGNPDTAWTIDNGPGLRNQPRKAVFQFESPVQFPAGTILTVKLQQNHGGWNSDDNQNYNLGRFRLSVTSEAKAEADPLPKNVRDLLAVPAAERTPEQVQTIFRYWRTTVPEWKQENEAAAALWKDHPEGSTQLVLQSREDGRSTHMLTRGDFLQPAKAVTPGVPSFLHPLPQGAPPNRLTFAKWLVDRQSPTTARSMVNRFWQQYFGTGLVSTSENFGMQADAPSHPELLDWLAVEFMDRNWSMKAVHRLIVTSNAYRQSSNVTPDLLSRDPDNRLLARGPRFRVEAEVVRDIALRVSGLLNTKVGGPSVQPPAPSFLFLPPVSYGPKVWKEETGPERYRRALYTFRFRSVPYPMLQTFDAPNGDFSCVRRPRSNTPLQALVTLNEPMFLEAAQALALKTLKEGGADDSARLSHAFEAALARRPSPKEQDVLLSMLAKQKQRMRDGWLSARDLTGLDVAPNSPLPAGVTPTDWGAWTAVSRVLLNLDETITKE
jgi:hypothetical protein